ncbi:MAG: hypothetical protein EOP38_12765 [Rubrivivax sp.]|nr:MAG: hypothetical protein EOP38_12765 [Rubrivivax sp.]
MKKHALLLMALLSSAAVFAQSNPSSNEIVVNTDPDKVAEVERHAQELKEKQEAAINSAEPTAAGHRHKAKRHQQRHPKTDSGNTQPTSTPPATQ